MKIEKLFSLVPLTLLCALAIFVCDLLTPLGTSEWVLYLLPLLFTSRTKYTYYPFCYAVLCSVFIVVAFLAGPKGGTPTEMAYIGRCLGIFVMWITSAILVQSKLTEAALAASEKRFIAYMDNTLAVAWMKDENFKYVYVNQAFERIFQLPLHKARGKTDFDLWSETVAKNLREHDQQVLNSGKRLETYEIVPTPNGQEHFWLVYKFPFADSAGRTFIGGLASDITERRQAEDALRDSELRFRSIWENSADGMRLADKNGNIVAVNESFCRMMQLKPEDLTGKPISVLYSERQDEIVQQYRERFSKRAIERHLERSFTLRDGRTVHVEVANSLIELAQQEPLMLSVFRDVTERKRAEEQRISLERKLLDGQKLESLGVLAGGIAHDFNNLLTGLLGNTGLALMQLPDGSPARANLTSIEKICMQAADLCKQMLAYSGRGQFVVQKIELNSLVEEMGQLLQISISKKAVLRFALAKDLPPIQADASQIRQIVMNLIINASEALGNKDGVITVHTGVMRADKDYLSSTHLAPEVKEGRYVFLEVTDTGCGMSPETRAKIFDPFFTTKFTGRGLGLAAVLGIVRGHKGALKVYSELGKGTTFKVLFPASEGVGTDINHRPPQTDDWKGSGTILVVDDEEPVREVTARMLQNFGFTVLTAVDGQAGVDEFQKHARDIRAVVLDMTMPQLGGEEVFREIRRIQPEARVLLTSGYNEQDATTRFAGKGLAGFLQKPFKADELRQKLRAILDGAK